MLSSRYTSSRASSVTAASTAAISSGSGGSGMYSLAPAWMAATAARASLVTPQAQIGTWMRSASSRATRSRMSSATSTIIRSAPRPERSTASACSLLSACVTLAPLSIAILLAVVSCPPSVPTIRSRMALFLLRGAQSSVLLRLDDFRHGHAELVFDQPAPAARPKPVVDVDVDRLADLAVELDHRARPELEEVAALHARAAEHRRNLDRHVEYRLEIDGAVSDLGFASVLGGDHALIARRGHRAAFEVREGHSLVVFFTHRVGLRKFIPCSRRLDSGHPRIHVTRHDVVDRCAGCGDVADHAAVAPFDPAVAGRQAVLGLHHQAAVEAAALGELFQLLAGLVV